MMRKRLGKADLDTRLAFAPREAAVLLGLSPATMDKHLRDGSIPSVKLGGRRLVSRMALEALLRG
jgi:excisionase family DNA binding protein